MEDRRQRRKILKLPVYDTKLEFCITADVVTHYRALCEMHNYLVSTDVDNRNFSGLYTRMNHHIILVHESKVNHNTISHEIYHASRGINRSIGIDNEESDAWLCGYISEEIYKFLDREGYRISYAK